MSIKKKLLVLLSAIAMIMSVITVVMAAAEGAAPKLSAEKSGDNQVVVILSATEELTSLNDLQYTVEYNTDAFSYGENDIECLSGCSVLANLDSNLISISETVPGSTIPVSAGGMLSKITFTTQEGYDPTQLYTFKFKLTEAYDQQLEEYSWGKDTFTATLQEQIIPEEEHVTFIDTAGTSTKLYDSVIRSCTPTANDNYMLSDVLAAAGADTSNLAKCRYKLASNDGFTVYLDADEYANLALFYNNGWRSTLEDPTGYEGGWYKVKGLETITAENHKHENGVCTNPINTSKDTTVSCGDEEEYVTFIDTAGTSTKLYDSVIRSCTATENDNYMLSDVLTAAGADTSNLADCRYEMAASDGTYTIYLKSDEYPNLALFYNKGWRSTLEDTTGYEGGWYKIKGLETITAENHQYENGICTNPINTSKDDTVPCGDEEEHVTFIDTAGTSTKLYDSVIRSCTPTANDNYMLSDVLTAAGADTTSLAECRYKLASNDGFTVYLDADEYANLALFYNKGWRSTLEDPTGYEGGWYKVKGLETITAENHIHENGVCTNPINTSKDDTVPCGDEEEHVTFIDTAGTVTKLYDSIIRSCTPTENDNYMLSDVLTAAGADTTSLAECRYKLASNDGFTVYLDADEYANLALFYNKGWRSTLEDPTGYEGGWYKVKGLGTITAQNHQLAGCECTNRINTSRDEAELCDYNIHDWGEGEVTTEPDCENPGIRTFTCSHDSSHTRTEEIPALGHDWDDGVETTEPTCENAGVRTFTCKNNPEHTRTEAIDPAGHTWDTEKTEDTPATCETEGEKSIHCSICGAIDPDTIETIPALGHDWDDGVETTEPTCETAGVRTFTCKNNSDHTYTETIEPLGHDWDDGVVTTEASCETPGEKTFTCKNDEEHKKKEEIPALGHTPSEAVKENVVEATTEQEGSYDEVVYCSVCHKELSRTKRTIDKITYKCVEGEGQTWSKDDKEDLQFRFKRTADDESTFDHFKGIKVDGKEVDASNYTAEKGSVIINLKSGFVKTLSAGEHTLTALFDDSDPVDVKFIVAEEQKDSNTSTANKTSTGSSSGSSGTGVSSGNASDVKTGDNYSIMIYLLLMCFSAMIIAVTFRKMRRSDIHNK